MRALLIEPLTYGFFARALVAGVLVGALCGALSVFVVLRRMSYIGHGLAHAVLGGVAVGVALGIGDGAGGMGADLYLGAIAATAVAALLIDRITRRRGLQADAAIGIVTVAIFAAGVAVLAVVPTRVNLEALLFGNILGVGSVDLWVVAGVATLFALVLAALYKRLVFTTFDAEVAAAHGVPTGVMHLVLSLLTAAVVVASVRVLGVLLIAAAVVIPGATARVVSRSLGAMLAIATLVGIGAGVTGLYASYHVNVPSGPMIVLTGTSVFAIAFAATAVAARLRLARARVAAAR